jgi:hypothetical protein
LSIIDFIERHQPTGPVGATMDIETLVRQVWAKHKAKPHTITVRPDGFYADDEPDTDDGLPLAVGDVVRWNFTKKGLLEGTAHHFPARPYLLGIVERVGYGHPSREGKAFVHMSTGAGAWFDRDVLRKDVL